MLLLSNKIAIFAVVVKVTKLSFTINFSVKR